MNEKREVLDALEGIASQSSGITFRLLLQLLLIAGIVMMLLFPKIYLQSQIYYKSRDIAQLQREHDTLKEENRIIKARVESIRFENQILDTMF